MDDLNMQEHKELSEVLSALTIALPMIQKIFPLDIMFAVTDKEKFIYNLPGRELDAKLSVGAPIPLDSGIRKVLATGEVLNSNVPKHVFGVPFKSTTMPIKCSTKSVIGVLTVGISLKNQEILSGATQTLTATSEEVSANVQEIAEMATDLNNTICDVKSLGKAIAQELRQTDEILSFIRNVAGNSNLIGLNAAIEAARAREHGRGFAVVADEIRKMATTSFASAQDIAKILLNIRNNIKSIEEKLIQCSDKSQHQVTATGEISSAMQQLAASTTEIEKISRII